MSGRKRTSWSMKSDRELIELAKSHSLEAIAEKINRSPATVLKQAVRLGLSIKRKAKGK
jgi:DNA-binding CsgD family transcriptional regulator